MNGSDIEMARPEQEYEPVPSLQVAATRDDDDESLDSNYDEPLQTLENGGSVVAFGSSPSLKQLGTDRKSVV